MSGSTSIIKSPSIPAAVGFPAAPEASVTLILVPIVSCAGASTAKSLKVAPFAIVIVRATVFTSRTLAFPCTKGRSKCNITALGYPGNIASRTSRENHNIIRHGNTVIPVTSIVPVCIDTPCPGCRFVTSLLLLETGSLEKSKFFSLLGVFNL